MTDLFSRFSLPLLAKELIEQSARRRLFITRVAYALLLFVAAMFLVPVFLPSPAGPFGFLGIGKRIFQVLISLQFAGIYLFLPAMTCGAIIAEKERHTLGLLLLTKLGPWTIIFEMLGSRIVPMLTLLLTSLPLLAFTYALGGVDPVDLVLSVWFLVLSIIQVGSFAILAAAYFRSTATAFLATYVMLFLHGFGLPILDGFFLRSIAMGSIATFGETHLGWLLGPDGQLLGVLTWELFFPPGLMSIFSLSTLGRLSVAPLVIFLFSLPSLFSAAICIGLARWALVQRAFLEPVNPLLRFFKNLDQVFIRANKRFTGGVVVVKQLETLPDVQPIAWREMTKRSLGQFRYLVRIFIPLEFPVLFMVLLASVQGFYQRGQASAEWVSVLLGLAWVVVALLISAASTSLIISERSRQTLDVLLTSPLSSRRIILEKMSAIRRLMWVCAVPLLTCVGFQTWWRYQLQLAADQPRVFALGQTDGWRSQLFLWPEYLAGWVLSIGIYLPLIAWLSLWIGIRTKSHSRAIAGSLGILIAWCLVPIVVGIWIFSVLDLPLSRTDFSFAFLFLSSPAMLGAASEMVGIHWLHPMPYLAVALNSAIYASCWWLIRRHVLEHADEYLGRLHVPCTRVAIFKSFGRTIAPAVNLIECSTPQASCIAGTAP